ncbi:MAG: NmrA family transcriptional regulator [Actinomycetota bacterium]|nr:NmrA family transcriptional regulator [Actinomycetota bacterium]
MTKTTPQNLTLVLGATGTIGRRVAERLLARDVPVRLGSRSAEPPFDWEDETTWAPVLAGVDAAYLVYAPDLVMAGAVDAVGRFADLAVAGGVRRLVLLSGRGEPEAQRAEQVVLGAGAEAGVEVTIVRSAFFAQDFSEKFFVDSVLAGTLAMPAGKDVGEPFVDADDIADVVVAALTETALTETALTETALTETALTEDGHAGEIYEVTGPRLLTFPEALAEISRAAGRELAYVQITREEFAAGLTAEGLPNDLVVALTEVASTVLDGRSSHLADGVRRALGREPRDFADYTRAAAATGVWDR